MSEKVIISLLSIQLVQSKLSYLEIGNLHPFNIVQLLKFNIKEAKRYYNNLELPIIKKI